MSDFGSSRIIHNAECSDIDRLRPIKYRRNRRRHRQQAERERERNSLNANRRYLLSCRSHFQDNYT